MKLKKVKMPGENISLKTKKTEDPLIMQWLNAQTNLMDSLRYLMEKEISEHGVRNLQAYIPMERNMLGSGAAAIPVQAAPQAQLEAQAQIAAATAEREREVVVGRAAAPNQAEHPSSSPERDEEEELDEDDIEAWI